MSQQLPLPMRLRPASVFDTFCTGDNHQTVASLKALRTVGHSPVLLVHGPAGSGKTHLLQALCAHHGAQGAAVAFLPLADLQVLGPDVLAGTEQCSLLCIDDLHLIAADMHWNRALFSLHRDCEERQVPLVLASQVAPTALAWALPDLSSRLLAGNLLRLRLLNDADQLQALQMHALQRGFDMPMDVALYLQRRMPRDMNRLCDLLDKLDAALLAAQRRLSIPFVREWLDSMERST